MGPGKIKFIADTTLGRLAKWLPILGYDTAYASVMPTWEIIQRSVHEKRIILTRGARTPPLRNAIFLASEDFREQLRELAGRFSLDLRAGLLTRCLLCNRLLLALPATEAETRIPPYVFQTQKRFQRCPQCGRIYWEATHKQAMIKELAAIFPALFPAGPTDTEEDE